MEGTLVVNEKREKVNKFQEAMERSKKSMEISGKVQKIVCDVGGVVCLLIPGAQILAPILPILGRTVPKIQELECDLIYKGGMWVNSKLVGDDGSNKDVSIPDFNVDEIMNKTIAENSDSDEENPNTASRRRTSVRQGAV